MKVDGLVPKLNDPIPTSEVSSGQLQQLVKTFSENLTSVEDVNDLLYDNSSSSLVDTPLDESSDASSSLGLQKKLRKSIQKKPRSTRFKTRDYPDYMVTYELNMATQRMNKVWTCKEPSCLKKFRKVCSLKDHVRLHKNSRPFPCAYCGRGWA